MRKFIAIILLFSLAITQVPIQAFATESTQVVKDSEESMKIYRKTSKTPAEERKGFNQTFHSSEPLGLEVMGATEIDILVEGNDISGTAELLVHDVDNLKRIQTVRIGEVTTVKLPRKGQLFLDVANVKYDKGLDEKFEIDVKLSLNEKDYIVTPTFDIRENKLSEKVILNEEEFKKKTLSEENKENGTLLIGENVRIYIPVSKYIPEESDTINRLQPKGVIERHELMIQTYNEIAGLSDEEQEEKNKPRKNFVLVSARNEQIGHMSAGSTMLDTAPSRIRAYLSVNRHWGQSHEYGHLYEKGFGFVERWCNTYANAFERILTNDPTYNWIYGSGGELGFEEKTLKPNYTSYLNEGKSVKEVDPLYYFLNFVDNYDKDYIAKMSQYYDGTIPYQGIEYVAYFAAMNYGINIIPYLEMGGHSITNYQVIKDVVENATSSYMYISDNPSVKQFKNISLPPTMNVVYVGENRVLNGMSNKNATIFIQVDGKEYSTKADGNGKFSFELKEAVNEKTVVKVASQEPGKQKSFYKKQKVESAENEIIFKGFQENEFLKVKLNKKTNKFEAVSNGQPANPYAGTSYYAAIKHFDKRGVLKDEYSLAGGSTADRIAEKLNELTFVEGDYIKLHHAEKARLSVKGYIENTPLLLDGSVQGLDLNNSYFYVVNGQLQYSDTQLDLGVNKLDLQDLLQKANVLEENEYTKTTWNVLQPELEKANMVYENVEATKEEVTTAYSHLQNAMESLRKINVIEFKGYNNELFLSLGFDTENKQFIATSTGKVANGFSSGTYGKITHFDQKGVVKGEYTINAKDTGDTVAAALHNVPFTEGDFLKFYHKEQGNRFVVKGYLENEPSDLTNGAGNLDLTISFFYLTGENLQYSDTQLDLSANKEELIKKIEAAKKVEATQYTKTSFVNVQEAIKAGEEVVATENMTEEEVTSAICQIEEAITNLKAVNVIEFKGYNNEIFLSLGFDIDTKKFIATSSGKVANQFLSRVYGQITHYDKKGNVKGDYAVQAGSTADAVAEALNKVTYIEGDYLKFYHREQGNRLVVKGHVENSPSDLSNGVRDLDLTNSFFYLTGENLSYSTKQLDLSSDKTALVNKLEEVKKLSATAYTKTTFSILTEAIKASEALVQATNVTVEEVKTAVTTIETAVAGLKAVTIVEFKGYNNELFLSVGFDTEAKKFVATSTGKVANRFSNGVYGKITYFDKKGNVKGEYAVQANGTADATAEVLNKVTYTEGDFLKFYHKEQNGRLSVKGYVENSPSDLSNGVGNLDLGTSLFYLTGENLKYSKDQLDLSSDKSVLVGKLEEVKKLSAASYIKSTFGELVESIQAGEALVEATNVTEEEIKTAITTIEKAVANLKEISVVEFKGYNNEIFLSVGFDTDAKKFIATSSGNVANRFSNGVYGKITHFDQKGNVKGDYVVQASGTADAAAEALNKVTYTEGDYLKFYHKEQGNRFVVKGHLENSPSDLSNGVKNLDLTTSFFYLTGENLSYSTKQLDLSSDKTTLVNKLKEVKQLSATAYTKTTFSILTEAIKAGEALVQATNVTTEEVKTAVTKIETAVAGLKAVTIVEFKGYNNELFLSVGFDTEAKKFVATSTGKVANRFSNGVYGKITYFDKKGNVKGEYAVQASGTADAAAEALNKITYTEGDFLKFYHKEQVNRLAVKGYVENGPSNLSNGVGNLDLTNSLFYLTRENLSYSSKQLDLSSDKTALVNKLEEVKKLSATDYTKSSFSKLTEVIKAGEALVKATNVTTAEIKTAVTAIETAVANLKEVNVIEFKGYNNEIFLRVGFDMEKKKFVATSNGKMVHPYQNGRDYASMTHYDKDGTVKGTYTVKANGTADDVAKRLNEAIFVEGDFLTFAHIEQNSRLVVKGYVKNTPANLSSGVGTLNLQASKFTIIDENLTYGTK